MIKNLGFGLALLLAGCGAGSQEEEPACEAGRVEACPCADGSQGTQACAGDGSAWGACMCASDPGGEMPKLDPKTECAGPDDNNRLDPANRCRAGEIPYAACSREILAAGICVANATNTYKCCPG